MYTLAWVGVGVAVATLVLGLVALFGASRLRSDMYKAPDKTVWGLLSDLPGLMHDRPVSRHHAPEHQAKRDIVAAQAPGSREDSARVGAATEPRRARKPRGRFVRYDGWVASAAFLCCILGGLIASALIWHWVPGLFLVGALLGLLAGGGLCIRYLRHEVASDIGPTLRHMQGQLDNLEAEINLSIARRAAERGTSPHTREAER
jgi:hypothetical protein